MSEEDEKEKQENISQEKDKEMQDLSENEKNITENKDEENNSDEDENYVEEEKPKKKKKEKFTGKKRNRETKKKKKNKKNANSLIDIEADEDENEEEESYHKGELTKEQQEYEMKKALDHRSNRFTQINDENVEEIVEHYNDINQIKQYDKIEEKLYDLPTSEDPKIWIVKCKIGDEKEIMENLYHKYFYFQDLNKKDKEKNKDKVKIFSAISFENLKGKIYIEAFTERDVAFAIQDMSNVNKNSIQLVPVHERAQIFEYDKAPKTKISLNQLVRIKGGNYDGDLARVIEIEDPVNKISVAMVPRIIDDPTGKKGFNVAPFGKTRPFKPRQKLFDKKYLIKTEQENNIKEINESYGLIYKLKNLKFLDGLLIRTVKRSMLETENVSPKDEELAKLGCIIENGVYVDKSNKVVLNVANKSNVRFRKGDEVKMVNDVKMKNTEKLFVLETETDDKIKVEAIINDEKWKYSIPKNQLVLVRHNFKDGDLVYAKFGKNEGRKGIVIQSLENGLVTVYDDVTKTKFEAKNSDLIFIEDMEINTEENEMFKIGELVCIKNTNIICYIIESTKFIIKVVTINNEVKKLSVRDVDLINSGKRISSKDGKGNPLDLNNSVRVINGKYKDYTGVIQNTFKKYLFLQNNEFNRSNGIFCELSYNTELLGSEILAEPSAIGKVNHRRVPNKIKELTGKTVHIIQGTWKGYNGIVLNGGNDKNVRIELIAKQKIIEVPFDYIDNGDVNSAKDNAESNLFNNHGMKTPAYFVYKDKWE